MHISYLWIVIAAVVMWLLGALWYGVIFKKSWHKLVFAEGEKPKNAIFAMATSLVACLLLSFVLAHVIELKIAGTTLFRGQFTDGFQMGVICWLGFMAPPLFAQHIWEGRRANLFAINAGYWLLAMAIGGAILAAFH
jgi:hypothetical protein